MNSSTPFENCEIAINKDNKLRSIGDRNLTWTKCGDANSCLSQVVLHTVFFCQSKNCDVSDFEITVYGDVKKERASVSATANLTGAKCNQKRIQVFLRDVRD